MAQVVTSSLLSPILTTRFSKLEVLGASSGLIWLALDGHSLTIQQVAPDSQLALPTSIFFAADAALATEEISLRGGRLTLGGTPLQITRWWRPPRAWLVHWPATFSSAPAIDPLLGLGNGLTPEGDDLLAGWLVAARSISHPEFETIRAEVLTKSHTKTTTFSATLLECAGQGYGVAPLIDYVNARLQGLSNVLAVREHLSRVGHTSGEALAIGVDTALGLVDYRLNFSRFNRLEGAIA